MAVVAFHVRTNLWGRFSFLLGVVVTACSCATASDRFRPQALGDLRADVLECRKARIAAKRLPRMRWIWASVGAKRKEVELVEEKARSIARKCVSNTLGDIRDDRLVMDGIANFIVARFARQVGMQERELAIALENRFAQALNDYENECKTASVPAALALASFEFEATLDSVALGVCEESEGTNDSDDANVLFAAVNYTGAIRSCMNKVFEETTRLPADECGIDMEASGEADTEGPSEPENPDEVEEESEPADDDSQPDTYVDDEGNEHVVTSESRGDTGKITDITCDGMCIFDADGNVANPLVRDEYTLRNRDDGSVYYTHKKTDYGAELVEVKGREIVEPTKISPVDLTADPDAPLPGHPFYDPLGLFGKISSRRGERDCMAMSLATGVNITYLVSDVSPDSARKVPVTVSRGFDHCTCVASQESLGIRAPASLTKSCGSEQDFERVECLRDPVGPWIQCSKLAIADTSVLMKDRCPEVLCDATSFAGQIRVGDLSECGCMSVDFVEGYFKGRASDICSTALCYEGACVCGENGCGCSDSLIGPPISPGASPFLDLMNQVGSSNQGLLDEPRAND